MNGLAQVNHGRVVALMTALLVLASVGYGAPISLTNGVPATGLSGAASSETMYAITVPSGQDDLTISISGGTGDCDLYVKKDTTPTTSSYDYRPFLVGNNETVTVTSPAAGTYYIMLRGYIAYAGLTLTAAYTSSVHITTLTNNVAVTGLSGTASGETYFMIEVPASQTKLEISISGGTGDCDLYVKKDATPTTTSYDYRPFLAGNNEKATINDPAAGTYYIMLRGYSAFSGLTLLGVYTGNVGTLLTNGVAVTGLSGAANSEKLYRIEVPSGQISLEILISGGTGDCDLYVKRGAAPTTTTYDYRPFLAGNEESVTVSNPTADTWYILLRGYSAYASLTLKATYGAITTLTDGVAVSSLSGALNSETFYQLDVPADCSQLVFSISGGTGNCDLYVRRGSLPTTTSYDYRPYLSGNNETATITNPTSGSWYVLLKGRAAYSGVTLLGDYTIASTVRTLVNGVPVSGLSGAASSEVFYQIVVPSGQTSLVIQITGGTGDADLYVKYNAPPTVVSYDARPFLAGNEETATFASPNAGTWMIMLRGYSSYASLTLVATYTGSGGGGGEEEDVTTLSNGVAVTGLSDSVDGLAYFKIVVPSGQTQLDIVMSGGTGDADMYVRFGSKPTGTTWDFRPFLAGNDESVSIVNPEAGTYYIMLDAFQAYSGVSLIATYTGSGGGGGGEVTTLTNGVPVTGLSGDLDSLVYFKIVVPSGQDLLHIAISGGTGDADLTVKKGSKPTLVSWDYNSSLGGNTDYIDISHPAAATWYILLNGFTSYSGVTLVATYSTSTPAGNLFSADPNCVAVWNLEPSALMADSRGANTLTNNGVTSSTADFQQGTGSGIFDRLSLNNLRITDASLSATFPTKSGHTINSFSGACWVKLNEYTATAYLMSKYYTTGKKSWALGISYDGNVIFQAGYSNGTAFETKWGTSGNVLAPNKWYHIAFAYNDSAKTCYVRVYDKDAAAIIIDETFTFAHNMSVTTATVALGSLDYAEASYSLDGLMDEVVIFNDLLTTTQIDQIRQGTYGH
jgi:hypothetical protein